MDDYRQLADAVASDIAAGRRRPGDRLAPQRLFARRHGIANSTAGRVYRELVRRGLVVGEVGRGTFVRAAEPPIGPTLAEPDDWRVDLELNFSVLPEQPALLARSLNRLLNPGALAAALRPASVAGTAAARDAGAVLLSRVGWTPAQRGLLFAGNGRQALAAAIAALVPVGERLGVERYTYPVVKAIASRLGVTLVPLDMDDEGVIPDALRSTQRMTPLRAVYLQPTLHNPLGITMPERRRAELADALRRLNVYAIEDTIYAFLRHGWAGAGDRATSAEAAPPIAAMAPAHTVVVDSLSKRLAPGLTLGFAATPANLTDRVAAALRSGGWTAPHFALDAATCWITDGTVALVEHAKRRDASARQGIVADHLAGFAVRADPYAYHCWWHLPEPWRAETFVAAASRRDIAITPAAAFAVRPGHSSNAVRLALASPTTETLAAALDVLAGLARGTPEDAGVE